MPFTFAEVIILYYIFGTIDASKAISYFDKINITSTMNWNFETQLKNFLRRFTLNQDSKDARWLDKALKEQKVSLKNKILNMQQSLKTNNQ